ncbi:MAG: hypothetical protein ACM37W_05905 [Actinomycetota bacterium]
MGSSTGSGTVDKAQLEDARKKLYDQINDNWRTTPTFTQDLVYRVKAKPDGTIVQYEATNKTAKDYVQETPLAALQTPASPSSTAQKTVDFRVTFSPKEGGVLDVKPWQ